MSFISNMLNQAQAAMAQPMAQPMQAPAPMPAAVPAPTGVPTSVPAGTSVEPPVANPAEGSQHPAFQQAPSAPPQEQSGLAQYADLFNTVTPNPDAPQNGLMDSYIAFDEQQVLDSVQKRNFVPNTPEVMGLAEKALQGDAAAFTEVLNRVAQSVFFNSAQTMARVSDVAAREGVKRLSAAMPDMYRSFQSQNTLAEAAPAITNPGVQPVVAQVRENFQRAHPNASPQAIAEMTQRYFSDVSAAMNPQAAAARQPTQPFTGTDFSNAF